MICYPQLRNENKVFIVRNWYTMMGVTTDFVEAATLFLDGSRLYYHKMENYCLEICRVVRSRKGDDNGKEDRL